MKKQHVNYFDYLRILASFCVVYMHVAAGPLRGEMGLSWHLTSFFTGFGFIAVPLFFMMSGYLILNDEKTANVSVLLKHRIPHLLVPLVVWSGLILVLYSYLFEDMTFSFYLNETIDMLSDPIAVHLWYLYTLIALYVISPVLYGGLKSLDSKGHRLVFSLIALVSLATMMQVVLPYQYARLFNVDLINKVGIFSGHLCTFILGYYLGNSRRKVPNTLLILLGVSVLGIITYGTYYLTVKNGAFTQSFHIQGSGFQVVLAAIVFLFAKQTMDKPIPWKWIDLKPFVTLSFGVYFIHIPIIDLLDRLGVENNCFKHTAIQSVLIYFASFLIMKTVATIKPLCYITTGISYQKACESCNWIYTFRKIKTLCRKAKAAQ